MGYNNWRLGAIIAPSRQFLCFLLFLLGTNPMTHSAVLLQENEQVGAG